MSPRDKERRAKEHDGEKEVRRNKGRGKRARWYVRAKRFFVTEAERLRQGGQLVPIKKKSVRAS